jgi:chromate transporter
MGYQAAGILGALTTLTGIMLPSTTLALVAARWGHARRHWLSVQAFKAGMAPLVVGLLLSTGWILTSSIEGWHHLPLTLASALLVWRTRIHLLVLISVGALVGALGWI